MERGGSWRQWSAILRYCTNFHQWCSLHGRWTEVSPLELPSNRAFHIGQEFVQGEERRCTRYKLAAVSLSVHSFGLISITVLPLGSMEIDETEETFTVSLISTTNNVIIDSTLSRVVITVEQNGSPFGVVSFLGEALSTQSVTEQAVSSTFVLPLERDGDNSAAVDVSYVVSRVGGDGQAVALDVTPASGSVAFPVLQGRTEIVLTIIADQLAELDEAYSVRLLSASNGATINSQASTANFIIR